MTLKLTEDEVKAASEILGLYLKDETFEYNTEYEKAKNEHKLLTQIQEINIYVEYLTIVIDYIYDALNGLKKIRYQLQNKSIQLSREYLEDLYKKE